MPTIKRLLLAAIMLLWSAISVLVIGADTRAINLSAGFGHTSSPLIFQRDDRGMTSRLSSLNAIAAGVDGPTIQATQNQSYILRAWEFDTDRGNYLWSLESDSDKTSPKTLYRSLDSPAIRTKVASLSPGTKIVFDYRGGGSFQATDKITGGGYKTFLEFAQFCKSKHIAFTFWMVAN